MSPAVHRPSVRQLAVSVIAVVGLAALAACGPAAAEPAARSTPARDTAGAPAAPTPEGAERATPPATSAAPRGKDTTRRDTADKPPARMLRTSISVSLAGKRYTVKRDGSWTRVVAGRTTAGRLTNSQMTALDPLLDGNALARESRYPAPDNVQVMCCYTVMVYDMAMSFRGAATKPRPKFDSIVRLLSSLR